ncbi:MAG: dipicolinate synthase [Ruminococcaceae bacterium]|nr:dipicolinate synthase [Oscillospiraceae bacterium]
MKERVGIAVLGGDERQIAMARALAACGYHVKVWGLGACADRIGSGTLCEEWTEAIEDAGVVILPLPASADGVRVHCPLQCPDLFLRMTTLLDAISGRLLLGGKLSEAVQSIAEQKGIETVDYFHSEVLQLKNALPTVEGAIEIAMRELPVTIDGVSAAVIGYGRIGALLGERLWALGADVTVYARRQEQLALAELHHHRVKRIVCRGGGSVPESIAPDLRVIFNTVPQWIFTRAVLEMLPRNCLLIDLASAPGGIDRAAAQALGLRTVWATALPGKCAPESAGEILADTVRLILAEYAVIPERKEGDDRA